MPEKWWESAPLVEDTGGFPDFDVTSGASSTGMPITLAQMQREAAENETPEQRSRRIMEEGESQGAGMALRNAPFVLAGLGAGSVANARLLPFLMRLGAGRRGAGAVAGGAASIPAAVPALARGDLGGAAKAVGAGAITGAVFPGAFGAGAARAAVPAAAPVAAPVAAVEAAAAPAVAAAAPKVAATIQPGSEVWYYANRLRQVAETSAANRAAVMEGIKQDFAAFGFPTWQDMAKFVFAQRTRP